MLVEITPPLPLVTLVSSSSSICLRLVELEKRSRELILLGLVNKLLNVCLRLPLNILKLLVDVFK